MGVVAPPEALVSICAQAGGGGSLHPAFAEGGNVDKFFNLVCIP